MNGRAQRESTEKGNIWYNDVKVCDIEEFHLPESAEENHHVWLKACHSSVEASQQTLEVHATNMTETYGGNIDRLMHILKQVSIAEYIRTIQSFYKDSEDDLKLVVSIFLLGILRTNTIFSHTDPPIHSFYCIFLLFLLRDRVI